MRLFRKFFRDIALLVIFTAVFLATSCLKKQNLQIEDLGSSVPPEEISSALSDGFGIIDYNDIKVNENTKVVLTQSIQDGANQVLEKQDVTVLSINNNSLTLELSVLATITNYSGGSSTQDTRVWNKVFTKYSGYAFSLNKSIAANAANEIHEPMYMFQMIQNLALGSCYNEGNYPETCHNLTVTELNYRVPPEAADQHACIDIYNCYIKAKKLEFDLIRKYDLESDGKPKRIHYTLVLSKQTPFTAKVLHYCTRSLYDITGVPQKILADLCYSVVDYTFGQ